MSDDNHISDNIAGRQAAQIVAGLAEEEAVALPSDFARGRFWEQMQHEVASRLPAPLPARVDIRGKPMGDVEAKEFGARLMRFGTYKGFRIDEIELRYLVWLAEGDEFTQQLKQYIKSRRVQAEQGDPVEVEESEEKE